MNSYIKVVIAALLPVALSVFFYLLEENSNFKEMKYWTKQSIFGVTFGLLAIIGTEWSIPIEGAILNCRDTAVITAGLFFGAPAGVIAGIIGGIERWIAVAWGVGYFTKLACSLSTILAGIIAALFRKYIFENQKPGWLISAAIGVILEVLHLCLVFLLNMDMIDEAMGIIRMCARPVIIANALSVMFSAIVLSLLAEGKKGQIKLGIQRKEDSVSQSIQRWLLLSIVVAFIAIAYIAFFALNKISIDQTDKLLTIALNETEADIRDASNENLLRVANRVVEDLDSGTDGLEEIAKKYHIAEINVVNADGKIIDCTDKIKVGTDFHEEKEAAEFLCLLDDTETFVQAYDPTSSDEKYARKYAGIKYRDGFIQVGYDASQFQQDLVQIIPNITKNRHVGEEGFILIVDQEYNVVSAPDDVILTNAQEYINDDERVEVNESFTVSQGKDIYWAQRRFVEGYRVVSLLPEYEVVHMRNVAMYVNCFLVVLVFAVLFVMIYIVIKLLVVNQIKGMNASLNRITNGDLEEVVDVRSNLEFSSLSDDINKTVDTLKQYIDEASKRIDQELEVAKNIQTSTLPNVFPAFPNRKDLDIFASMNPAKEVGGDFYDFYMTENHLLHFLVADVSGKGIPAAMFMMRAKNELKRLTDEGLSLSDIFERGNANLCEGNDARMFLTAWQGCLDLDTGLLRFVNAGHNLPLLRRKNGDFEFLEYESDFVLAGLRGMKYNINEIILYPGDTLYVYTDGVTEAQNVSEKFYGDDRLKDALNRAEYHNMQELCMWVKDDLDTFVGDAAQFDDITMLALQYLGSSLE